MPHRVGHLEDALLAEQRFHLVPGDDVALLERLDGKVLAGVPVLGQNDLAEVTPAEDTQQPEAVDVHTGRAGLRLAAAFVRAVPVLEGPRRTLPPVRWYRRSWTGDCQVMLGLLWRLVGLLLLLE